MIEFKGVSKHFLQDKTTLSALKQVSFKVNRGEIFGIVGMSGSGKSTLLRCLSGLESIEEGSIWIEHQDIAQLTKKQRLKQKQTIATIFQGFNLLSHMSVEANIALPLRLYNHYDPKLVDEVLDFVKLKDKRHQYPRTLSGGEKQRVAIARALVTSPSILLCDEPTSSLDFQSTQELIEVLANIQTRYQTTIVFVSHELDVIKQLCDRVILLDNGEIVDSFTLPKQALKPQRTYQDYAREVLDHESSI